jgi:hypothetical protein
MIIDPSRPRPINPEPPPKLSHGEIQSDRVPLPRARSAARKLEAKISLMYGDAVAQNICRGLSDVINALSQDLMLVSDWIAEGATDFLPYRPSNLRSQMEESFDSTRGVGRTPRTLAKLDLQAVADWQLGVERQARLDREAAEAREKGRLRTT